MPKREFDEDVFPDWHIEYAPHEDGSHPYIARITPEGGLTLRDFFAGQALSGLIASGRSEDLAASSYAIADRMLDESRRGGA